MIPRAGGKRKPSGHKPPKGAAAKPVMGQTPCRPGRHGVWRLSRRFYRVSSSAGRQKTRKNPKIFAGFE